MDDFLNDLETSLDEDVKKQHEPSSVQEQWNRKRITLEERQKYGVIFDKADVNKSNSLDAQTSMKLLSRSKLDPSTLTKVFSLADNNGDQCLNRDEFIIAMYLIQCKLAGEPLPDYLPESLAPAREKKEIVYSSIPGPPPDAETPLGIGVLKRDLSIMKMGRNLGQGPSFKIVVLGEQIGKSALITRFLFDEFSTKEEPTVEDSHEINYHNRGRECHLRILDTSGNDIYFDNMIKKWISGADGFMLVYSIDNVQSFRHCDQIRSLIMGEYKDDRIPIVLVGTKADRKDNRQVSIDDALQWCQKYNYGIDVFCLGSNDEGMNFVECSAKTGDKVEQSFQMLIDKMIQNRNRGIMLKGQGSAAAPAPRKKSSFGPINFIKYLRGSSSLKLDKPEKADKPKKPNRKRYESIQEVVADVSNKPDELNRILEDPEECEKFREFLSKKGSGAPCVMFWTAVEDYKSLLTFFERRGKGNLIFNSFFFKDAPMFGMKIPEKAVKELKKGFLAEKFNKNLFDDAQFAVYTQIKEQFFPEYVEHLETNPEVKKDLIEFEKDKVKDPSPPSPPEDDTNNNNNTPEAIAKHALSIQEQLRERGVTLLAIENQKLPVANNSEDKPTVPPSPTSPNKIEKKAEYDTFPSVPVKSSYSELPAVSEWYFGPLSRQEAESILQSMGCDSFLIRTSSTIPGCYVLSRWTAADGVIIHFIVKPSGGGYEITDCPTDYGKYLSLVHLVETSPTLKGYTAAVKSMLANDTVENS